MDERNEKGQFKAGWKGGPGRPRAETSHKTALLAVGQEIVTAQTWRSITNKAILDALGKKVVGGQVVDDADSTAQGRNVARTWLTFTYIGKPTEYISSDLADSPFERLATYSTDDIAAAIAAIERERQHGDDTGDSASGVDAAGETGAG